MGRFKPIKRDMNYLFPPSMNDWLPEHHLARFIVEIVEQLDLKVMERAYGTSGSAPFHPARLLSILDLRLRHWRVLQPETGERHLRFSCISLCGRKRTP